MGRSQPLLPLNLLAFQPLQPPEGRAVCSGDQPWTGSRTWVVGTGVLGSASKGTAVQSSLRLHPQLSAPVSELVDGCLRIPPFLPVKQFYFLTKPAFWASWKKHLQSLQRCRPPVAAELLERE